MEFYYYVDYENVGSGGIDRLDTLTARDHVYIIYSENANSMKISTAVSIMKSPAEICFSEVVTGTKNALDFQLVAQLFHEIKEGNTYYIISKDNGFDAAIAWGQSRGLAEIRRFSSISTVQTWIRKHSKNADGSEDKQKQKSAKTNAALELPAVIQDVRNPCFAVKDALGVSGIPDEHAENVREKKSGEENAEAAEGRIIEVPRNDIDRIQRWIFETTGVTLTQTQCSLIGQALDSSGNRSEFYKYIEEKLGQEGGGELYHLVRPQFESLKTMLKWCG